MRREQHKAGWMRCVAVLLGAGLLGACSSGGQGSTDVPVAPDLRASETLQAPDLFDQSNPKDLIETLGSDAVDEPFQHAIYSFEQAAGASGITKGDYSKFSFEYPPLDVSSKYEHVLTFAVTPMLPPWRKSEPGPGPVILFSENMEVLVVSPMDHFFVSQILVEPGKIRWGLEGEVDSVPAGFRHRFLVVEGVGIQRTLQKWGELLLADRGKIRVDRYADAGLGYLGYWTDNGAYYYYKTEPEMTEAATLLAVKSEADELKIPYGYMQLDSWWYFKGEGQGFGPGGLLTWEPQPQMFPEGLTSFQQSLGLPLILHNRWFSPDSPYVSKYPFQVEGEMAFPSDGQVYDEFASNAASWGAATYEQDWLVLQYLGVPGLRRDVALGESWMKWMDEACQAKSLTMQLCMSGAPHLMASLDMKTPTSIRTSIDYAPSISKESFWPQFHTVNMVAWALGLWPFKDNFHSSEKHAEAEALISILSGGMVGLGDALGKVQRDIVMRTCRSDGLLLKPDRPAFPIDAMFLPHQRPLITFTYSQTGAGQITYLAVYNIARKHPERTQADELFASVQYDLKDLGDFFVFPDLVADWHVDLPGELRLSQHHVAYDWRTHQVSEVDGLLDLGALEHLYDFHYVVLSPIQANGLAFLGEPAKYVTASDRRFPSVQSSSQGMKISVAGVPGEEVGVLVYDSRTAALRPELKVVLDADGKGELEVLASQR